MKLTPIVFVHGLWIHASSWQEWMDFFRAQGYDPIAPAWPGDSATVEESREHPELIAGKSITDVTEYYAAIIRGLPEKPIVIGHSFGGLVSLKLLDMGLAKAAVVFSPAPSKGVYALPLDQLRAAWPVLKSPFNYEKAVMLTAEQFQFGFGNALAPEESNALYEKWAIPGPGKPILSSAAANFLPNPPSKVNVKNATRGPLLLIAASKDRTVPAVVVRSQRDLYMKSTTAITDFKEYADRGHSLSLDHGWKELAEYSLAWLKKQGI